MALTEEELAELQKVVVAAAEVIENKLTNTLKEAIEGINTKVDLGASAAADIEAKAKITFEALPKLIQEHVETQLKTNLTGIVEEVGKQFEAKVAQAGGGNSAGVGSMGLRDLLAESDKVINVINAWRQPTTEQAMLGQMNFVMKWHALLSKLEKGGGSGDEFTKAIASTFTTEKE